MYHVLKENEKENEMSAKFNLLHFNLKDNKMFTNFSSEVKQIHNTNASRTVEMIF